MEDTNVNDSKYDDTEDTATDYMLIIKTFNWVFYWKSPRRSQRSIQEDLNVSEKTMNVKVSLLPEIIKNMNMYLSFNTDDTTNDSTKETFE